VGLYIAKSLVEAHGGHVWLEGAPGAGSTFTVLLPVKRAGGGRAYLRLPLLRLPAYRCLLLHNMWYNSHGVIGP
jgi:hypothetical protein